MSGIIEKIKEEISGRLVTYTIALFLLLAGVIWKAIPSTLWEQLADKPPKKVLWAIIGLLMMLGLALAASVYRLRKQHNPEAAANTRRIRGVIEGHVNDFETGEQIQGALVIAQNEETKNEYQMASNREGRIELPVPEGNYSVTVTHHLYITIRGFCEVRDGWGHVSFARLQRKPPAPTS